MPDPLPPRIGVSTPTRGGLAPWIFFWLNIRLAGGIPDRITPDNYNEQREFDGIIISGGADIDPALYGEEKLKEIFEKSGSTHFRLRDIPRKVFLSSVAVLTFGLRRILGLKEVPGADRKRDDLEVSLINHALENEIPMLGICRGMQLINVVMGGSLHQEIADVYEDVSNPKTVLPHKRISIKSGSMLADVLGKTSTYVNSLHHQSINEVGQELDVVAECDAGIIQAVEGRKKRFLLGVQWHPEFLVQYGSQRRIFNALVTACTNK
ncbi:gamma-glutamyl-gamma-aminobutyrate hydrolase family protein [Maridesulfovibrio sp.]|uniref:gamma-glutamyl-gamma-aminobutyrate hydrolase family protein n=1 Tax=Maridesulfovibrio sp. TaxID=2795000 RepID=UPI0029F55EF4|nr:gamma-glutamyl-gamma-aminobutyrate hydrolase family protein [Maridesulfovibrio sp.]